MFTKIKKTNEFQSALHLKKIEKEEEGVKNHKVEAFFMYRFLGCPINRNGPNWFKPVKP